MTTLIESKAALKSKRQALKTLILERIYNSLRLSTLKQVIPSRAKCFILLISRMMNHILEAAPTEYSLKGEEKSLTGLPKSHRSITAREVNEPLSPFLNNTQFLLTLFKMSVLRHFKVSKHFRSLKWVTKLICSAEAFEDKIHNLPASSAGPCSPGGFHSYSSRRKNHITTVKVFQKWPHQSYWKL